MAIVAYRYRTVHSRALPTTLATAATAVGSITYHGLIAANRTILVQYGMSIYEYLVLYNRFGRGVMRYYYSSSVRRDVLVH